MCIIKLSLYWVELVINKLLKRSEFFKNLSIYVSGSFISQIVNFCFSIIATRLYTAKEFGLYGVIITVISMISPVMSGKYEEAMVIQSRKVDTNYLLAICLGISFVVSALVFLVVGVGKIWISNISILNLSEEDILFIPAVISALSVFTIYCYYANSFKEYGVISKSKVFQAIVTMIASVLLAIFGYTKYGLIVGYITGLLAASSFLVISFKSISINKIFDVNKKKRYLLYKYRSFPVYNGFASIINGVHAAIPIGFISANYTLDEVGFYTLMYKSICMPFTLIVVAFSQVNLKHVSDLIRKKYNIQVYLVKSLVFLLVLFIFPTMIIFYWGREIFSMIYGEEWGMAGVYAEELVVGLSISFISSALSTTLSAMMKLKSNLLWQLFAIVSTFSVFSYYSTKGSINSLLFAQNVNYIFIYIIYFLMAYKVAGSYTYRVK